MYIDNITARRWRIAAWSDVVRSHVEYSGSVLTIINRLTHFPIMANRFLGYKITSSHRGYMGTYRASEERAKAGGLGSGPQLSGGLGVPSILSSRCVGLGQGN